MIKKNGIFITISGIDGSGKSTVQSWISEVFKKYTDYKVMCIDGLKPLDYTNSLKEVAKQQEKNMFELFGDISLLTYCLSLIQNYVMVIRPALIEGKVVITHRNALCCKAYTMLRDNKHTAMPIVEQVLKSYGDIDLHFYCDVDVDTALERIKDRTKQGYTPSINENKECLTKIHKNYQKLLDSEYKNVIILDTTSNIRSEVERIVLDYIDRKNSRVCDEERSEQAE